LVDLAKQTGNIGGMIVMPNEILQEIANDIAALRGYL
jgi:hypothetical protein